ncbi:MAG: hypothetical protein DRN06_08385, partial [Thermoprotei archaeon]
LSVHRGSVAPSGLLHDLASAASVWEEAKKAAIRYNHEEDVVEITYISPKAYLQASGRTSRMFPGGISRGLAITLVDDPYAFDQLIDDVADVLGTVRRRGRRTRTATEEVVEFEPFDPQEIMKYLREEVDVDRQTIRAILEGHAPKEIGERVRTALLIVESPTKARTISWLFGGAHRRRIGDLTVYETLTENYVLPNAPTGGHIFDLITGANAARITRDELFGVKVDKTPDGRVKVKPIYHDRRRCPRCGYTVCESLEICPICREEGVEVKLFRGIDVIDALRRIASEVDLVFIGTDPDAEGEKIGWDIMVSLYRYNPNIYRVRFHEITRTALKHAIDNPEKFNRNLVCAQLLRRIDDRWIGFLLSRIIEPQAIQRELLSMISNRTIARVKRVETLLKELVRLLPKELKDLANDILNRLVAVGKDIKDMRTKIDEELPKDVNEALDRIKSLTSDLQVLFGKVQERVQDILTRLSRIDQRLSQVADHVSELNQVAECLRRIRGLLVNLQNLLDKRRQTIDRFATMLRRRFTKFRHICIEGFEIEGHREHRLSLPEERPLFRTLYSAGRVQSVILLWALDRDKKRKKKQLVIRTRVGDDIISFYAKQRGRRSLKELRAFKKKLKDYVQMKKRIKVVVTDVVREKKIINPPPPFTTETLLQEANRRLGLSANEIMRLAQDLFESGLITYPRTDSPHVSAKGIAIARDYIERRFGPEYYKGRPWGPEGAHECIRPTSPIDARRFEYLVSTGQKRLPRALSPRHWRLYDLIFRRFIASQMHPIKVLEIRASLHLPEKLSSETLEISSKPVIWRKLQREGFNLIWPIKFLEPPKKRLRRGSKLSALIEHVAIIPACPLFSEGELVRLMMEKRVGRPSTYARTIEVLKRRGYLFVQPRSGRVIITSTGRSIAEVLKKQYKTLVSETHTRKLHRWMDQVEEGERDFSDIITRIYNEVMQIARRKGL